MLKTDYARRSEYSQKETSLPKYSVRNNIRQAQNCRVGSVDSCWTVFGVLRSWCGSARIEAIIRLCWSAIMNTIKMVLKRVELLDGADRAPNNRGFMGTWERSASTNGINVGFIIKHESSWRPWNYKVSCSIAWIDRNLLMLLRNRSRRYIGGTQLLMQGPNTVMSSWAAAWAAIVVHVRELYRAGARFAKKFIRPIPNVADMGTIYVSWSAVLANEPVWMWIYCTSGNHGPLLREICIQSWCAWGKPGEQRPYHLLL